MSSQTSQNHNPQITTKRFTALYGFSIFAMFFGSGNLVFPLMVGVGNSAHWFAAFVGFFLTGIVLPFMGLFVIKLYKGSYLNFFAETGPIAKSLLPFFVLSLLGPFGVIPRCITVAHGGLEYLDWNIPLTLFSLVFCVVCYVSCQDRERMFNVLGKIMTPILVIGLVILFIVGYQNAELVSPIFSTSSLSDGFFHGYATMDLFASFFFSSLVFKRIESMSGKNDDKVVLSAAIKASIVGASILAVVYLGFVFLGAHYAPLAENLPNELILSRIVDHLFGPAGALMTATIMLLSCLTTSVALADIYVNYLYGHEMFQGHSKNSLLLYSMMIAFGLSMLDFAGILAWLGPFLEFLYPALIVLTSLCLITRKQHEMKIVAFYLTLFLVAVGFFF